MESIKIRKEPNILVLIDKIDTFVAGEEYNTQRKYIEALLEVDEDMSSGLDAIGRKIFIRSDLFARLNFETLGSDKINDNTLHIKWHEKEIIYFIGSRIKNALQQQGLIEDYEIILDSRYGQEITNNYLRNYIRFNQLIPRSLKKKFINFDLLNKERSTGLREEVMKMAITKIFPTKLIHKNNRCEEENIDIFDFFNTHFTNTNGNITPRNILIFLKEVNTYAVTYYNDNPDIEVHIKNNNGIDEWTLYKKKFIYEAYKKASQHFIFNISKTDDKWSRYFLSFLNERGKKQNFDYNWIKQKTDLCDEECMAFCSYLEYIGFVQIAITNPNVKKRKYKLPIMYMESCR